MAAISAIVPTYERPALLRGCVRSLLRQTRPLAEILVVDDGSTVDVAGALEGLDGPIRLIRQENRGKAAAVNRGLGLVRGDYVWICDDDDLALPDAAARLGGALDVSDAGFVYGGLLRFREHPRSGRWSVYGAGYWPENEDPEDLLASLLDDHFVFQFAMLVRRSAYEAVGPMREDLVRSQDYEMALRLARRFRAARVEGPVFLQREHEAARGSRHDRFSAAESFAKWIQYDQRIFEELYLELPLEAYAPRALANAPRRVRLRAAHLKRACMLARRQLWLLASREISQACHLDDAAEVTACEAHIAHQMLGGKYGCRQLVTDRRLLGAFVAAFGERPYGQTLRRAAGLPLRWRTRKALTGGRFAEATDYGRAFFLFRQDQPRPRAAPIRREPAPALTGGLDA